MPKSDCSKQYKRRIETQLIVPRAQATDFWSLIHPEIVIVARSRFESHHYAAAAEAALKRINVIVKGIVKDKTGNELDGANLMKTAFSVNNPIILAQAQLRRHCNW